MFETQQNSTPTSRDGHMHTSSDGCACQSTSSPANPVQGIIAGSDWTHDDVAVALSALSLVAWILTTWYLMRSN